MSKIVALIPARGGSKGIPLKNIKEFCGKPLIYWATKAAAESHFISEVFIATDNGLIKNTVEEFGLDKVKVIDRSTESANDTASTELLMIEFANKYLFDIIIMIQATSPLITVEDINGGIEKFIDYKYDSMLSVARQKRFIWVEDNGIASPVNYDPMRRPLRQQWDGFMVENGAFYITTKNGLLESGCRISGNLGLYEMGDDSYFEMDEPHDWIIMEQLKALQKKDKLIDFNKIRLLICDVDGVLTDGGMYYSSSGEEIKKFNTIDGQGLAMIQNAGIKTMFLTREVTTIVDKRSKKLNIDYTFMGINNKNEFLIDFFNKNPLFNFSNTAYIGDDINDSQPMRKVYFSAAPSNCDEKIKLLASYVCNKAGGQGCVREVCDLILSNKFKE